MNRRTRSTLARLAAARPTVADRTRELVGDEERRRVLAGVFAAEDTVAAGAGQAHGKGWRGASPSGPRTPGRSRLPRMAILGVPAAAGIVAVLVAVGLVPVTMGGSAALADTVDALAHAVQASPFHRLRPGEYRYSRWDSVNLAVSSGNGPEICPQEPEYAQVAADAEPGECWNAGNGSPFAYRQQRLVESWKGFDGSTLVRSRTGEARTFGTRDQARFAAEKPLPRKAGVPAETWCAKCLGDRPGTEERWTEAGEPAPPPWPDPAGGAPLLTDQLPTDPDELLRFLSVRAEDQGGKVGPEHVFYGALELLADPDAGPALHAAVYRVLTRIQGVEAVGEVTDPLGRRGVAVATSASPLVPQDGIRFEAIFDPATGSYLAQRQILTKPVDWVDAAPGTVLGYSALVETGVVTSESARP